MPDLDIVEILKIGLPGLIFLLCAMSFWLLTKEQEKAKPSQLMLKKITQFSFLTLAFTFITLGSGLFDLYMKNNKFENLEDRELSLEEREKRLVEKEQKIANFKQDVLLSEIEPQPIQLRKAPENFNLDDTQAAICLGKTADTGKYIGRQILLVHNDLNMTQVVASFDGRCTQGNERIMVPRNTMEKLGIEELTTNSDPELQVLYQVAVNGQKFILPGE